MTALKRASRSPNINAALSRLEAYADARSMWVEKTRYTVSLMQGIGAGESTLLARSGEDVDMAAFYLVNLLERLGAEVPPAGQNGERDA